MDRGKLVNKIKNFKVSIKNKYKVNKMILFGSRASGKPHKDSDVDLMIVSPDFKGKKSFKRSPELYLEWHLKSNIDLPVDFLCYTPKEFNKLKKRVSIVKEALAHGIIIE